MIFLSATTHKLQLVTGSAADIEVDINYADNNAGTISPAGDPLASITTATTTDIVPAPSSGQQRSVRGISLFNNHASQACVCTVQKTDGTDTVILWKGTLAAGECMKRDSDGDWQVYTSNGILKRDADYTVFNQSTASQGAGFASDTYVTGSFVVFPTAPKVGTRYRCTMDINKSTGAGTATPIFTIRTGTAGTTSDTSRGTLTFAAGTAATSIATVEIDIVLRTVGSGTSATIHARAKCNNTGTAGFIGAASGTVLISSVPTFDSTTAGLGIGISFNGGTSFSGSIQQVQAEIVNAV